MIFNTCTPNRHYEKLCTLQPMFIAIFCPMQILFNYIKQVLTNTISHSNIIMDFWHGNMDYGLGYVFPCKCTFHYHFTSKCITWIQYVNCGSF
jgi:hypothetical protein